MLDQRWLWKRFGQLIGGLLLRVDAMELKSARRIRGVLQEMEVLDAHMLRSRSLLRHCADCQRPHVVLKGLVGVWG